MTRLSALLLVSAMAASGAVRADEAAPTAPSAPADKADAPATPAASGAPAEAVPEPPCPVKEVCDLPPLATVNWIGPRVDLDALFGQAILLVFVESWCPKCNEWAPDMAKQVQEAAAKQPATIIYLGVGMAKAEMQSYMERMKLEGHAAGVVPKVVAWEVGLARTLWNVVVIDTKGRRVVRGTFGTYRKTSAGKMLGNKFALDMPRYCEGSAPIVEAPESPVLKKADLAVRLGLYGTALALLEKAGDAGAEARSRLAARGQKMFDAARAYEASDPYMAYRLATVAAREFKSAPFAAEARTMALRLAKDKQVRREKTADGALVKILAMASGRADDEAVKGALAQVAGRFADCRGGRVAMRALGRPSDRDVNPLWGN